MQSRKVSLRGRFSVRRGSFAAFLCVALACHGTDPGTTPAVVPVAGVLVTPGAAVIEVGETARLTAYPVDATHHVVSAAVTWSTSNAAIVTVAQDGLIAGVIPGTATVTAHAGNSDGAVAVTVRTPILSISQTALVLASDPEIGVSTQSQSVQITATGNGAVNALSLGPVSYSPGSSSGWLVASINRGVPPATLTLQVVTAPLPQGSYTATVPILASGQGFTLTPVTLTVTFFFRPLFTAITAGFFSTCGVTRGGAAYCWGDNSFGKLGDGTTIQRLRPTKVAGDPHEYADITVGTYYSCALARSGDVYCWGRNVTGVFGDGTTTDHPSPGAPAIGPKFTQISAGTGHMCGITADGEAYCWGQGFFGALGTGTNQNQLMPTQVMGGLRFTAISAGNFHTCGRVSDGSVYCWGANDAGQLGDGTNLRRTVPTRIYGTIPFDEVSASTGEFTCARTHDGQSYCWGLNEDGYLGDGSMTSRPTPVRVSTGTMFVQVTTGGVQNCGLTEIATVWCWGYNYAPDYSISPVPEYKTGGQGFTLVSAGETHSCGIAPNFVTYCWGENYNGQVGDGTTTNRAQPVAINQ